jgi:hypothetical protein
MICALRTDGNHNRSTANTSTILTGHGQRRGRRARFMPFRAPQHGAKLLITGTASHLNHVPDTTCHIDGRDGPAGMRVAYITGKRGDVDPREGSKQADTNKAWIWNEAGVRRIPRSAGQKEEHSSTHKQATDDPALSGVFFILKTETGSGHRIHRQCKGSRMHH